MTRIPFRPGPAVAVSAAALAAAAVIGRRRWVRAQVRKHRPAVELAVAMHPAARHRLPALRPITPAEQAVLEDIDWSRVWDVISAPDFNAGGTHG